MIRFIETPVFTRQIIDLLDEDEYAALQAALVFQPAAEGNAAVFASSTTGTSTSRSSTS